MKKFIILILIFTILFSFASCGKKEETVKEESTPNVVTEPAIVVETTSSAIEEDGPVKLDPETDWQQMKAFFQQTEHTLYNCYRYEDPEKESIDYDGGCIGNLHLNDGSDISAFTNQKVLENGLVFELCMEEDGNTRDSYIVVHPTDKVGKVYVAFGGTQLIYNSETKKREPVEFDTNEFIYDDMESYINLCALKDNLWVTSYDIDDDGLCESLAVADDIGIYDCVNNMVVSSWVLQSIPGSSFCNMCLNDSTIKEEYINCISVHASDEKAAGIYSYSDGVLKRECSLEEATSSSRTHKLTEEDLPEIEALRADAIERIFTVCLCDNEIFDITNLNPKSEDSIYYELPQNELFNNKEELIGYLCGTFTRSFAEKIVSSNEYGIFEEDGKLYFTPVGIGDRLDVDDLKHVRFVQMESNGEIYYSEIMSYNVYDIDKLDGTDAGKEAALLETEQLVYTIKYEDGWKYDYFQDLGTGLPY